MKEYEQDEYVQTHAVGLLLNLAKHSKGEASAIVKEGGIERLVETMNNYDQVEVLARRGCTFFSVIGETNPEWLDLIRRAKGLSAISHVLQTFDGATSKEAKRAMKLHIK